MSILHSLSIDQIQYQEQHDLLVSWVFDEMRRFLRPISNVLTRLPRRTPNIFESGRSAVAGAPFELPYSLSLPDQEVDRWRMHRDLIQISEYLITRLERAAMLLLGSCYMIFKMRIPRRSLRFPVRTKEDSNTSHILWWRVSHERWDSQQQRWRLSRFNPSESQHRRQERCRVPKLAQN